jgi:hypothetical protein
LVISEIACRFIDVFAGFFGRFAQSPLRRPQARRLLPGTIMHGRLFFVLLVASASAAFACSQTVTGTNGGADTEDDGRTDAQKKVDDFERDGSVFDSRSPATSGESMLILLPSISYSGFDGAHSFKVPIQVQGSSADLRLEAEDPSAVTITTTSLVNPAGDKGKYFMIETKKAGLVQLKATSKGQSATARIVVQSYDPARWSTGEARYTVGEGGDPPCTSCHVNGRAIDHSPAAMAGVTDGEVSLIVSAGQRPNHTPIGSTGCTDCSTGGAQHQWTATPDELAGLVTYLRGLSPHGFE